jgi:hypothetical protein|tara:strand:- start:296 stop:403 length:108 start_codon:yes stop_codon:yes gene_type:complete
MDEAIQATGFTQDNVTRPLGIIDGAIAEGLGVALD